MLIFCLPLCMSLCIVSNQEPLVNWLMILYQTSECEGLCETIASLKQQLSDALELRTLSPVSSYSQQFTETNNHLGEYQIERESAMLKDRNVDLIMQAQVL